MADITVVRRGAMEVVFLAHMVEMQQSTETMAELVLESQEAIARMEATAVVDQTNHIIGLRSRIDTINDNAAMMVARLHDAENDILATDNDLTARFRLQDGIIANVVDSVAQQATTISAIRNTFTRQNDSQINWSVTVANQLQRLEGDTVMTGEQQVLESERIGDTIMIMQDEIRFLRVNAAADRHRIAMLEAANQARIRSRSPPPVREIGRPPSSGERSAPVASAVPDTIIFGGTGRSPFRGNAHRNHTALITAMAPLTPAPRTGTQLGYQLNPEVIITSNTVHGDAQYGSTEEVADEEEDHAYGEL
jgi:hypothetical protein